MRYVLVGAGRMGRAVEIEADKRGHRKIAELDPELGTTLSDLDSPAASLGQPEVAFEFTNPSAAEANLIALLQAGIPVVCGTTGWMPGPELEHAARASSVGAVIAPNFSVGVYLFSRLVHQAGRMLGRAELHRPWVFETHHTGKEDAPSGTARHLAELLLDADPRLVRVQEGNPRGRLPDDALHVVSLRSGSEPGTHTIGFDGDYDRITLSHRARSRAGFAVGAVLAAEWVRDKSGLHAFEEVVEAMLGDRGAE